MKTISGKRLCKILADRGWRLIRINGSHYIHESPDGQDQVSVPVHGNRDLRHGTQRSLMKEVGLTDDDLR